jgi:sulfatase modifying factor 1
VLGNQPATVSEQNTSIPNKKDPQNVPRGLVGFDIEDVKGEKIIKWLTVGAPAERNGVRLGDQLIAVGPDKNAMANVSEMTIAKVTEAMGGPQGDILWIAYKSRRSGKTVEQSLVRGKRFNDATLSNITWADSGYGLLIPREIIEQFPNSQRRYEFLNNQSELVAFPEKFSGKRVAVVTDLLDPEVKSDQITLRMFRDWNGPTAWIDPRYTTPGFFAAVVKNNPIKNTFVVMHVSLDVSPDPRSQVGCVEELMFLDSEAPDAYKPLMEGNDAVGQSASTPATQPKKDLFGESAPPLRAKLPLTWDQLCKMTGPPGPETHVFKDPGGQLVRIESSHGLIVLVAVERSGNGFSIAVANELAAADFTTRPWFTASESESLQGLYAEYVASNCRETTAAKRVGRFNVEMGRDRKYPNMPCFIVLPPDQSATTSETTRGNKTDGGNRSQPKTAKLGRSVEGAEGSRFAGTRAGQIRDDNALGTKLLWIPPGDFTMGSPKNERGRSDDENQVQVTLTKGFWLGQHQVTEAEWQRLMQTTPWSGKHFVKEGDSYPATWVSWDDAVKFCEKLTESERDAGRLPAGWTYTLPTEAQWEYACRGGTKSRFSFGDDYSDLGEYAWFTKNAADVGEEYAHLVGQKKPNPWGLYDMHGNVWDWCRDVYVEKLPGGDDPEVSAGSSLAAAFRDSKGCSARVRRGGSWDADAVDCRAASRNGFYPNTRFFYLGFRLTLSRVRPDMAEGLLQRHDRGAVVPPATPLSYGSPRSAGPPVPIADAVVRDDLTSRRDEFAGRWRIVANNGATACFFTLDQSFSARKSHVPTATAKWEIVGDEARITWSDGWRDILRPQEGGRVLKIAFGPGTSWNAPPANVQTAIKESPNDTVKKGKRKRH